MAYRPVQFVETGTVRGLGVRGLGVRDPGIRDLGRAFVLLWAGLLWLSGAAFAAEFSGRYEGIGTSTGMRLTLQEAEGRVVGRFDTGRGEPYSLNGRRTGEAAQGSVERGEQSYFFHVERRPLGLQFLLIPHGADGGPDIAGATDYSFVQQGLQLPEPSQYKAAPPRGVPVDIIDFIDGFRDWSPADMARVYAGLDDRYRELILLFDHAAAEMLWRVCTIKPPSADFTQADLARLLERQGTNCADYLAAVDGARKDGLLGEFVRKANFQFELIRETVKCDRNQSPDTKCADVGAMTSPLMLRWRRAVDLMIALGGGHEAVTGTRAVEAPVPASRAAAPSVATNAAPDALTPDEDAPVPLAPLRGSLVGVDTAPVPSDVEMEWDGPLPRGRPGGRPGGQADAQMRGQSGDASLPVTQQVDRDVVPDTQEGRSGAVMAPVSDRPFPRARPGRY